MNGRTKALKRCYMISRASSGKIRINRVVRGDTRFDRFSRLIRVVRRNRLKRLN